MFDDAYCVGAALAYLVGRMETFCGASGSDVAFYRAGDIGGIPRSMPATDVLQAQARNYRIHRHLYPEDHQEVLDASIAVIDSQQAISAAVEGFTSALPCSFARLSRAHQRGNPGEQEVAFPSYDGPNETNDFSGHRQALLNDFC